MPSQHYASMGIPPVSTPLVEQSPQEAPAGLAPLAVTNVIVMVQDNVIPTNATRVLCRY